MGSLAGQSHTHVVQYCTGMHGTGQGTLSKSKVTSVDVNHCSSSTVKHEPTYVGSTALWAHIFRTVLTFGANSLVSSAEGFAGGISINRQNDGWWTMRFSALLRGLPNLTDNATHSQFWRGGKVNACDAIE